MSNEDRFATIGDDLLRDGYSISTGLLAPAQIAALGVIARNHEAAGRLVRAGTGKVRTEDQTVRGDSIRWLDEGDAEESVIDCLNTFDQLRQGVNQLLFLNLHDVECHFAIYPPGAGYQKHLDQFSTGDQRRRLSLVLYLNEGWSAHDGGALRLYLDGESNDDFIDIAPIAGRLVVFESARFWHSVLPSTQDRLSVAGWLRTRS